MMTSRLANPADQESKKRKLGDEKSINIDEKVEDACIDESSPTAELVDEGEVQDVGALFEEEAQEQARFTKTEAYSLMTASEARAIMGTVKQNPIVCTRCGTPFECWNEDFCLCPSCEDELNG